MTRTLLLSTLLTLAVAGAASAETAEPTATVKLQGKTLPAIRAEVLSAADKVCGEALGGSMAEFSMKGACVEAAFRKGMADVHAKLEAAAALKDVKAEQVAVAERVR